MILFSGVLSTLGLPLVILIIIISRLLKRKVSTKYAYTSCRAYHTNNCTSVNGYGIVLLYKANLYHDAGRIKEAAAECNPHRP